MSGPAGDPGISERKKNVTVSEPGDSVPETEGAVLCPHSRDREAEDCPDCEERTAGTAAELIRRVGPEMADTFAYLLMTGTEFIWTATAQLDQGKPGGEPGRADIWVLQLAQAYSSFLEESAAALFGLPDPQPPAGQSGAAGAVARLDARRAQAVQSQLDLMALADAVAEQLAAAEEDQ